MARSEYVVPSALAMRLRRENVELRHALGREREAGIKQRLALETLRCFLGDPHKNIGSACGIDACLLCLAESLIEDGLG